MRLGSGIAAITILSVCIGQLAAADLSTPEAPVPPPQEERGIWAAIAYSETDEKHGFFWGADKRQEAMDIALKHCERDGGSTCVVVSVFRNHRHWDDDDDTGFPYNHCGALAVGEGTTTAGVGSWGSEAAQTRKEAEDLALQTCERTGQECRIREWVCT